MKVKQGSNPGISRVKLAIAFTAGVLTACGTTLLAQHKGDVVSVEGLEELQKRLDNQELVFVTGVDFKGTQYLLTPRYVKVASAKFPEEAREIHEPTAITMVPYSVNPNCALLRNGNYVAWLKYCK